MPIYEYRCRQCGHVTSFFEQTGDKKKHDCEKCGSHDTEKVFSTFAAKVNDAPSGGSSCPTGTCPLS